jgi:hypothetical protein
MAKLPTFKKGDRLKHGHVNTLSQGLNEANKLRRGGLHSWGHHVVGTAPWHQRLAIVVDPETEGSDAGGITCEGQAMIRFRWFDPAIVVTAEDATEENPENDGWATIAGVGEVACLDYKAAGIAEPAFGTILTVWWDGQSGSWIPAISSPLIRISWTGNWAYDTNKETTIKGTANTIKVRNMLIGVGAGEGWATPGEPEEDDEEDPPASMYLIVVDYTKLANYADTDDIQYLVKKDKRLEWLDTEACG